MKAQQRRVQGDWKLGGREHGCVMCGGWWNFIELPAVVPMRVLSRKWEIRKSGCDTEQGTAAMEQQLCFGAHCFALGADRKGRVTDR